MARPTNNDALSLAPLKFERVGLVVAPRSSLWWMRSYAMVPTVDPLDPPFVKVYFSGRDDRNRSHIGFAVLDMDCDGAIVEFSSEPVLGLGELGCFDDNGVTPSCVVRENGNILLYYIGWNQGATVRMHLFGGLAISSDGGKSFQRWSRGPILERIDIEPFLNTAPWVVRDGDLWRMYYVAAVGWVNRDLPRYHLRTATSADGRVWDRRGQVVIDFANSNENALARPCVLKDGAIWRMWFAHKGVDYRLGYAESLDGISWIRRDDLAGLNVSQSGFDSQMIEYAAVFRHRDRYAMLYNGNNYGHGGIGLAWGEAK
jgi:hypothetical protein